MWCMIWTESIWIDQKNLSKSGRVHEVMVPSAALYYEFQGRLEEVNVLLICEWNWISDS